MAMVGSSGATIIGSSGGGGEVEAGFAKLQGEDFEYYMQTYSIMLGRNSKKSTVDVDLSSLGGGMNISRHHARIFYDFQRRRFALDVIGKNGCLVEGVLHLPGSPPVKLDSQDLLQIGDKKFYFLLPTRSIFASAAAARHHPPPPALPLAPILPSSFLRKGRPHLSDFRDGSYDEDDGEDGDDDEEESMEDGAIKGMVPRKTMKRFSGGSEGFEGYGVGPGVAGPLDKKSETRSRADREADNHQLLQLEEKDVVSSVATVLSDLCGPGEWMPLAKLHAELVEQFGNVWHHSRVRRYLTSEEWPPTETKGRPWFGLLTLLRKYPEHFVINTRSKGRVTSEFVSLVSLLS
ncbi:FHA domain-containing protein FHA2-like [Ananas comosus]|uniref:FHA domain-containing protein FHA2-like n=1 Tax=Ananas comosus TaxID=4615 RepID=A0A6P5F0C0_ANACO|nr:FHA domain-containing protein FHA2-like [Ananas comosus]XP_020089581.1 FHA domain-containing protein FHA2-like [Ananas comosus]